MARIHQIHDKFVKRSLQEKRIAMAFLQAHLPAAIYQILNMETLTLTNKSLVPPGLREIHCDIVYQCQIDRDDGFIIFLIEHQSSTPGVNGFSQAAIYRGINGPVFACRAYQITIGFVRFVSITVRNRHIRVRLMFMMNLNIQN